MRWSIRLLLLAILAAVVILDKAFVYWRYVRLPGPTLELVETYDFSWSDLEQQLTGLNQRNYFQRFFREVMDNRGKPVWWVESRAGDEAQLIEKALSRGLWVLETIVTAAPLLGLLGTITGMMHAFNLIGNNGLVDPTGVTGGVAQALIATALGLFIAVIALFAFNFFSRRQSQVLDEMERLGTRMVDNIRMAEVFRSAPMKLRKSRQHRRGRIEIIPMIDVMFFLLVTFMLASLSMQNLHSLAVNLPQGRAAAMQPKTPVTLTITRDSRILLDETPVTLETLAATLKPMLKGPDSSVIVAADSAAPNGVTVQAMIQSRDAGAQHFLIAVKHVE